MSDIKLVKIKKKPEVSHILQFIHPKILNEYKDVINLMSHDEKILRINYYIEKKEDLMRKITIRFDDYYPMLLSLINNTESIRKVKDFDSFLDYARKYISENHIEILIELESAITWITNYKHCEPAPKYRELDLSIQ